jgi:hypothetical protein
MQIGLVWPAVGRGRVFPFANQRRITGRFARGRRCCSLPRRGRSTVGRHQNVGVPHVESPARFRAAANERFTEDNAVVYSITPHEGPFSPEWSLGVWGWASVASCFVPAESRALPSPLFFISAFSKTNSIRASFDQERERRAEARRQLYAVYQHVNADVSLVNQDRKHVSAPLDDFDTGAIIYF